jgi:hypothetical protein
MQTRLGIAEKLKLEMILAQQMSNWCTWIAFGSVGDKNLFNLFIVLYICGVPNQYKYTIVGFNDYMVL